MYNPESGKLNREIRRFIRDDRGSSLVAVIIMSAVILILGAALLSATYLNYRSVVTDKRSGENFYDAETAVNEIAEGLRSESESALEQALIYTETYYANTPSTARTQMMNRKFADYLKDYMIGDAFGEGADPEGAVTVSGSTGTISLAGASASERFTGHLLEYTTGGDRITIAAAGDRSLRIFYDLSEGYVELQNLAVTCRERSGYETTITTDIRVSPPENYFSSQNRVDNEALDTYAVIADGKIESLTSSARIAGDVYGGEGIIAGAGHGLELASDRVVSRKDLTAMDSGQIKVDTNPADSERYPVGHRCQIWVRNIVADISTGRQSRLSNPEFSNLYNFMINSDCYVADDLLMNNPGYNVRINGNYYGYHTGQTGGAKENSFDGSAVAINAAYANLEIAQNEGYKIWLAGTNKLDVNDSADGSGEMVDQGESLTYKWTQDAYLIPGSCIQGYDGTAGSAANPMSLGEYNILTDSGREQLKLNFSRYPFIAQVNIEDYLDPDQPYVAKRVRLYTGRDGAATKDVVYVYMNFYDSTSASKYFAAYSSNLTQRTQMTALADVLGYGSVSLNDRLTENPGNVFTGNVITFSGSKRLTGTNDHSPATDSSGNKDPFRNSRISENGASITSSSSVSTDTAYSSSSSDSGTMHIYEANNRTSSTAVINKENQLTNSYNGLISVLDERVTTGYPSYDTAEYIMDQKGLNEMNTLYIASSTEENGYVTRSMPVTGAGSNRHIQLADSTLKGILVADCDVHVSCLFRGTIITTGNVYIYSGGVANPSDKLKIEVIANEKVQTETEDPLTRVRFLNWKKN